MKVAIVHDWLVTYAGAERVLEQMLICYPEADIFCLVDFLPEDQRGFLRGAKTNVSFLQRMPFARRKYRSYFPLMPLAIEQFDLSGYDVVISSTHAMAKGVLVGPDQLHLSYVYSPVRWAWDLQPQYLAEANLERGPRSWLTRWLLHKLRLWDVRTALSVDAFATLSHFVARRIRKCYRRDARVIYPPVDVDRFTLQETKEDYYVTASRMVPYKKIPMIIGAFAAMPDKKLVVIGDGPEFDKCKAAAGPNVQLLGYQPFEVLKSHLQRARAFIFAAQEDFGIAPLEAQACGTPVIAYGKGAATETIRASGLDPRPTGLLFDEQTSEAVAAAVSKFEQDGAIAPADCRDNAMRFSPERFRAEFTDFVESNWRDWQAGKMAVQDRAGNRLAGLDEEVGRNSRVL